MKEGVMGDPRAPWSPWLSTALAGHASLILMRNDGNYACDVGMSLMTMSSCDVQTLEPRLWWLSCNFLAELAISFRLCRLFLASNARDTWMIYYGFKWRFFFLSSENATLFIAISNISCYITAYNKKYASVTIPCLASIFQKLSAHFISIIPSCVKRRAWQWFFMCILRVCTILRYFFLYFVFHISGKYNKAARRDID